MANSSLRGATITFDKDIDIAIRAFTFYTRYGNPSLLEFTNKLSKDKNWIWPIPSISDVERWQTDYKWNKKSKELAIIDFNEERNLIREEKSIRSRQLIMLGDVMLESALRIMEKADLETIDKVSAQKLLPTAINLIKDALTLQKTELSAMESQFEIEKRPEDMSEEELRGYISRLKQK